MAQDTIETTPESALEQGTDRDAFSETIDFPSAAEMEKPVPPGTIARVEIARDRETGDPRIEVMENDYGKSLRVTFRVVEGEWHNKYASMFAGLSGSNRRLRAIVEVVTGVDLSQGGEKIDLKNVKAKLATGIFEAELGPSKNTNQDGVPYTNVYRLVKRVGESDAGQGGSGGPMIGEDPSPDDIPF